jgi:hypothetical protein
MFDLFSVKVKQTGNYVHITGVPFNLFQVDIGKLYNTSLVTKWMIRRESWNTIKVHNFFLVELKEILKELLMMSNLRSRRRDLNDLKLLLESETWLKDTVNPVGRTFDFKKLSRFNTTLFPKQREFLEQYPIIVSSYHLKGLLLDSAVGSGKAMPYSTPVKVPGGWSTLGELSVADKVIGPQGNVAEVTAIYPQGVTDCYKFLFEDGRVAESHPLHQWEVYEDNQGESYVTTTQDIINHFNEFEYSIPLVGRISGVEARLSEEELASAAIGLLSGDLEVRGVVEELHYEDRLEIVHIMMEYEGGTYSETGVTFLTKKEVAADNLQQLIWSLGGIAFKQGDGTYTVDIKQRDIRNHGNIVSDTIIQNTKSLKIIGITKEAPVETLCISIDSEDCLYIVDNWVVTHNTFTAICWAELVTDNKKIVVCPLNIVEKVWVTELHKHYKNPPRIWRSDGNRALTADYDWYIVHYDYLQREGYEILKRFLENLKAKPVCIIDESHNMNEIKAKRTQRMIELADANVFQDMLPMSGTALKAQGSEIFPIVCMIDRHFDRVAREFFMASYGRNRPALIKLLEHRIGRGKFTIPELKGLGKPPPFEIIKIKVPGAERFTLDAIRLQMQTYINDRLAFYHKNLPEMIRFYQDTVEAYAKSVKDQKKETQELLRYKEIVNRFRSKGYNNFTDSSDSIFCKSVEERIEKRLKGKELADFRNVKSAVKYLGLKLRGEALGNVLGKARIDAIKSMIEFAGLPEMINNVEKKTLIFTSYVEALQLTENYLTAQGFKPVTVYGENNHEREATVKRFELEPDVNPLSSTYKSLKEGYPLIMANQLISLDAPFRDYEIQQVQGRIWRTGQDAQCFFKMLDMDTGDKLNITTRSLDILSWSKEQVDLLLGRVEGHAILNNITGQEMWDMGFEPATRPIKATGTAMAVF